MEQLVRTELIELNLKATDRKSVIGELTQLLEKQGYLFSRDMFLRDVYQREEVGNTAVGFGVAIPHGKSSAVKKAAIVFGRSEVGIDWEAIDGAPVHTVFLLAVPDRQATNEHLKILAKLSRALINDEFRGELSKVKTPEEVVDILARVAES